MIRLERQGDVFVLIMAAGENRWNTTFVRAFDEALDEVATSEGPASLVTASDDDNGAAPFPRVIRLSTLPPLTAQSSAAT